MNMGLKKHTGLAEGNTALEWPYKSGNIAGRRWIKLSNLVLRSIVNMTDASRCFTDLCVRDRLPTWEEIKECKVIYG